jgi:hypothetical protein
MRACAGSNTGTVASHVLDELSGKFVFSRQVLQKLRAGLDRSKDKR